MVCTYLKLIMWCKYLLQIAKNTRIQYKASRNANIWWKLEIWVVSIDYTDVISSFKFAILLLRTISELDASTIDSWKQTIFYYPILNEWEVMKRKFLSLLANTPNIIYNITSYKASIVVSYCIIFFLVTCPFLLLQNVTKYVRQLSNGLH